METASAPFSFSIPALSPFARKRGMSPLQPAGFVQLFDLVEFQRRLVAGARVFMLARHLDERGVAFGGGAVPMGLVPVRAQQLAKRIACLERDAHAVGPLDASVGPTQIVRMDNRH